LGGWIGSRLGFTGRTPTAILSSSLIPALYLIWIANCRQSCSAMARAVSFAATVTGVRVLLLLEIARLEAKSSTTPAMFTASAGES
jgi:hypothetical protein